MPFLKTNSPHRRTQHNTKHAATLKSSHNNQPRTMAFFPRATSYTDASFTPLFRLLEDFDAYSNGSASRRTTGLPTWQPKFDVRETGDAYELHGELPGIARDNVHIEFTEPQTVVIRGKVERSYSSGTPPSGHIEAPTSSGAITEGGEDNHSASHKVTVEDEAESVAHENGSTEVATPATSSPKPTKSGPKAKYWLSERSVGEFSRSFNFPTRVDHDGVSASLKDGVLSVTVPKAKKHAARAITIN